jgi:hypothetical protein
MYKLYRFILYVLLNIGLPIFTFCVGIVIIFLPIPILIHTSAWALLLFCLSVPIGITVIVVTINCCPDWEDLDDYEDFDENEPLFSKS